MQIVKYYAFNIMLLVCKNTLDYFLSNGNEWVWNQIFCKIYFTFQVNFRNYKLNLCFKFFGTLLFLCVYIKICTLKFSRLAFI